MGEDFDWKVGQVVEEIGRMKPDIDAEVNAKFGEQLKKMGDREQGTLGNVQASELDKQAPKISEESKEGIKSSLKDERSELNAQIAGFRQERTEFRTRFVVDQYFDGSTELEKTAAFDAANQTLFPPPPQPGQVEENGHPFDPDSFDYSESVNENYESLTDEFNYNAPPQPGLEP
jgi:hypothetical protein